MSPPDTTGNFQSLRPILEVSEHGGAGEAHIGAGTAGLPFNLPPGHYRSLGHHHNHREVNTSVYFPMSRAQVSSPSISNYRRQLADPVEPHRSGPSTGTQRQLKALKIAKDSCKPVSSIVVSRPLAIASVGSAEKPRRR